jgi:urease accessory protein
LRAAPAVGAGQSGSLRLSFGRRGAKTVLTERHTPAPFGAVRANHPDGSGTPEVQITNPSGGILGGDRLQAEIELAPNASAIVLTQAADKAYRGEEAFQQTTVRIGDGAFFEYLPHHLIPYAGSNYRQGTEFSVAPNSTLIAWDAFSAGRVTRGERFAFDRLRARTSIFRDDVPEVVDGFDLAGGSEHFGGYPYVAAAYIVSPEPLAFLADRLHDSLSPQAGSLASANAPAPNLCAVRILAHDAPALYGILNRSRRLAREFLGLPPPARGVV